MRKGILKLLLCPNHPRAIRDYERRFKCLTGIKKCKYCGHRPRAPPLHHTKEEKHKHV